MLPNRRVAYPLDRCGAASKQADPTSPASNCAGTGCGKKSDRGMYHSDRGGLHLAVHQASGDRSRQAGGSWVTRRKASLLRLKRAAGEDVAAVWLSSCRSARRPGPAAGSWQARAISTRLLHAAGQRTGPLVQRVARRPAQQPRARSACARVTRLIDQVGIISFPGR